MFLVFNKKLGSFETKGNIFTKRLKTFTCSWNFSERPVYIQYR